MKGATAVPCVTTTNPPNINKKSNIGINQNFFLAIINLKNSFRKLIKKLISIFQILSSLMFFGLGITMGYGIDIADGK